jgi:hypothetical protein
VYYFRNFTRIEWGDKPVACQKMRNRSKEMKTLISIAILCITISDLWSQIEPFAPIGARWHYRPYENMPDIKLYTFTVTKDTFLDGLLARELSCSKWVNNQFVEFQNLNKYVAVRTDAVYYYVDHQWALLFDFGAQPGDTIWSKVEYFDIPHECLAPEPGQTWTFGYSIDSIGIEIIGGYPLRVQYVSGICDDNGPCWLMGKIVERIGAINSGYWWGQGTYCILGGFPGYLRCYEDDLVLYTKPGENTPCDYVGTHALEDFNILIAPNPSSGMTYFSFSPLSDDLAYKVLDNLGHMVETGNLNVGDTQFQLNLESRPSGLYYVEFALNGQVRTYKVVKI